MAIPQSKKLGLDLAYLDPNLEARLRNIEKSLERKVTTPTTSQAATETPFVEVPASVTGVRLVSNVGTIQITWDESEIANLLHYEVQAAKDTAFSSGVIIEQSKDRIFTFQEGEAGTVYFVRIRAITQGGIDGDFSITLNTATGQAATGDIGEAAVTTVKIATDATAKVVASVSPGTLTADLTYKDIVTLSFTKDEDNGSDIIAQAGCIFDSDGGAAISTFRIIRDAVTLVESGTIFVANANTISMYFGTVESGLGAGTYTYAFQALDANDTGTAAMATGSLIVQEQKR